MLNLQNLKRKLSFQSIKKLWNNITGHWWLITKVAVFVAALIGFLNNGLELITNHIAQKHAEDSLGQINSGVSIRYVESLFGVPIVERKIAKGKLTENLFSFNKFYLQVIFDESGTVRFYAVTSKDKNFRPALPYIGETLGSFTFGKSSINRDGILYSNKSSKFYEYAEYGEIGFPANYRKLYLAFNPMGAIYDERVYEAVPSISDTDSPTAIQKFRAMAYPNSYGVGSTLADETKFLSYTRIGIDFYTAVDLPNIDK